MANETATRRLQWCSGHRVLGHENKCATLHGHNYVGYFTAKADELDSIGRVIDFSVLKKRIGDWIDCFWDHTTIIYAKDKELVDAATRLSKKKDPFVCNWNPTAENMARFLLNHVCPTMLKGTGVRVIKVKLYETENCYAEAVLEG